MTQGGSDSANLRDLALSVSTCDRARRLTKVRSNGLHAPRLRSLAPDATKDLLSLSGRYLPGWSDHPAVSLPNVSMRKNEFVHRVGASRDWLVPITEIL